MVERIWPHLLAGMAESAGILQEGREHAFLAIVTPWQGVVQVGKQFFGRKFATAAAFAKGRG
jgi:hypothetical protein